MRTAHFSSIAAVLAALGAAGPAHGQAICQDTETVRSCHARLFAAEVNAGDASSGGAAADEADELHKKAAGPNVSENLAQSAIRDFLPRFAGTLLTSDPADDLQAVDLRFNTPMGRRGGGPAFTLQGGVTLHKAELYGPLIDSIPEGIRGASRDRLKEELERGDDATAFATLNLESREWGRSFANHQDFVDSIAAAFEDSANSIVGSDRQSITAAFAAFSSRLGRLDAIDADRQSDPACVDVTRNPMIPRQIGLLPVGCLGEEARTELESILAPWARAQARRELTMQRLLDDAGFERVADLVNNQPQLNFSAEYRSRVGVVGPNEWVGRVRFEMGFASMGELRRRCASADPVATDGDGAAAARNAVLRSCLRSYTRSPSVRRSLARSQRLWLSGEVRYRPEYDVSLPADSVDFTLGSGVGFGVSGGYGQYLGSADADDEDRDRIDLHVSYDHADGEDLRQSRFLAGVFYTLRISGSASGVVGLAWASKPEFLDGADRRLHANLGLSYKFNPGTGQD